MSICLPVNGCRKLTITSTMRRDSLYGAYGAGCSGGSGRHGAGKDQYTQNAGGRGSGNNGGDGFAVARLLKEKGCDVEAAFIGNEESRSPDCMQQMKIAENCGVPVVTTISRKEYTVIVDAVFGVGPEPGSLGSIRGKY